MATQLAGLGPNPDLRSGKFGPQPTIGSSHCFDEKLTLCLMHVERTTPQIVVKTFFLIFSCIFLFFFLVSKSSKDHCFYFFGLQPPKVVETLFFGLRPDFGLQKRGRFFFGVIVFNWNLFFIYSGPFLKFLNFSGSNAFSSVGSGPPS